MFDYRAIKDQVTDYVSGYEEDFDIDGIMDELRAIEPEIRSIDDVEGFDELIQRHDVSGE